MSDWRPVSEAELQEIVFRQLKDCSPELVAIYHRNRTIPVAGPIVRFGKRERVFVVARKQDEFMYYEDVEEGFNFSAISRDGGILERWRNQDELRYALLRWHE